MMKKRVLLTVASIALSLGFIEAGSLLLGKTKSVESAADIRRDIVVSMLKDVYLPNVNAFQARVETLAFDLNVVCSGDNNYSELEESLSDVYSSYGVLEVVKFGSLADPVFARDIEINPLLGDFNACIIDQQVSTLAADPENFKLDASRKIFKGLSAIEYLMTDSDLNHSCSKRHPITANWDVRADEEKKSFRCKYLNLMVKDLKKQADLLKAEWDPSEGDLAGDIERNEMGNSSQDLLNQLADGMYFLERFLKDAKLARPLGFKEDCTGSICTQEFERRSLRLSLESIIANLDGFISVFIGDLDSETEDKKSFYSLLEQMGREDIGKGILDNLLIAKINAEDLMLKSVSFDDIKEEGFNDCSEVSSSMMCGVFKPINDATFVFKTEFYSVLNLRKPDGIPVDND